MNKRSSILQIARYFIFIATIFFGSMPLSASAIDIPFFQGNDILYYDGSSGNGCTTVGASYSTQLSLPSLVGNDNAEKIWNFLKSEGLSDEQAAGVMGNIEQESGYDPGIEEGDASAGGRAEKGFGIVQWTFERRTALEAAAEEKGVPASDLAFQLAYMVQESKSRTVSSNAADLGLGTVGDNEWDTLKKMETVEDATVFWHNNFEVSADSREKVLEVRGGFAARVFEHFSGKVAAGGTAAGGAACSAAGSGDLIATLLEYAHPTHTPYAGNNRVDPEPKPAYAEIAKKLVGEGKWVGGGQGSEFEPSNPFPGIDCGGFVSILLTQSGFEPDYNFGLDMDRGASNQQFGQRPWAERNWTYLGEGGEINVSDLRPGDVAYSDGHTFIFVGQVDGFESQFASASYRSWRAPMAAGSWEGGYETAVSPEYSWYGRREGTPPEYGSTDISDPITATNVPYNNV